MIKDQAKEMGLDQVPENVPWPEQIEKDNMYFSKSKQLDLIVNHSKEETISNLARKLGHVNKVVQKEAKKCKNYDDAITVMYKIKNYYEIGADHTGTLANLSVDRGNKTIEKEIFQTLQTLESRNIVSRQQDLQSELRAELEQERALQEKYKITKDRLNILRKELKSSAVE